MRSYLNLCLNQIYFISMTKIKFDASDIKLYYESENSVKWGIFSYWNKNNLQTTGS